MKLSDYDFELPPELIAQHPLERRDASRLFVHDVPSGTSDHRAVRELPDVLRPGDLLVVNDTRVIPARLSCRRLSGGRVECLLIEPDVDGRWFAWISPSRRLELGEELIVEGESVRVRLVDRPELPDGSVARHWSVHIETFGEEFDVFLERVGRMPLPPYIERGEDATADDLDRERYQTVYARVPGAIAAPTAGLHLTDELFARLAARGIELASVTLHVGPGTFQPIQVEDLSEHQMHSERYELSSATQHAIRVTREHGGRVIAVGTTSARVLEACSDGEGGVVAGSGQTDLFLTPQNPPRVIDGLLTNFHLPKSSLLVLVASIVGRERALALYEEAIERRYRFYSYGDASLLLR